MTGEYAARAEALLNNSRASSLRNMKCNVFWVRLAWFERHAALIDALNILGILDDTDHQQLVKEWYDDHDWRDTAAVLGREALEALPVGTVVWRESHWVDEEGEHAETAPMMRCVACGKACLADGESQTLIADMRFEPDGEDAFQERYWSGMPTDAQRAATPWEGVSGE